MFDRRHPLGWLFYLLLSVLALLGASPGQAPATTTISEVQYRGQGRALARVTNPASIAAQQNGSDDGVRGFVREVKSPSPRTSADCENAALALLGDPAGTACPASTKPGATSCLAMRKTSSRVTRSM